VVDALCVHRVHTDEVQLGILLPLLDFDQLALGADSLFENANDQVTETCCCLHNVLRLFSEECLVMLLDNMAQSDDPLQEDHRLEVLLELRQQEGFLVMYFAEFVHFILGSLANGRSQLRTKHHRVAITDLLSQAHLDRFSVTKDSFAHFCANAEEDREHFPAMGDHEARMVENLINAHNPVPHRREDYPLPH